MLLQSEERALTQGLEWARRRPLEPSEVKAKGSRRAQKEPWSIGLVQA